MSQDREKEGVKKKDPCGNADEESKRRSNKKGKRVGRK